MKILHYIPSIDRTSGGVGAYMQLLTAELGKLVELHVVTHREKNPLELENCKIHFIKRITIHSHLKEKRILETCSTK